MKKNFLISTGGTGGHVVPAIILSGHLREKYKVIISTDKRGLRYLDEDISKIEIVNTPKLNNIFLLPFNLFVLLLLTIKAFLVIKKYNINEVISTGGYMSLPLIFASKLLNLNLYLVEPNHVLGRSNRYFLNSCKKIFCYNNEIKNFPEKFKNKIKTIFPLVRKKIYNLQSISQTKNKFTILIVGGSQSANIFNGHLKNVLVKLSKNFQIKIIHQTNENNIDNLKDFYMKNNLENEIFSFKDDFSEIIKQVDLSITRAGASTLAELSLLYIPFIAVPLPSSKDNHQLENAKFYKNNNCCWVLEQKLFDEKIEKQLYEILDKKSDYLKKKENLKKLNYQNTWNNVNEKILKAINEN